jgi:predicted dienelactone hydrolase
MIPVNFLKRCHGGTVDPEMLISRFRKVLSALIVVCPLSVQASVGFTQIPGNAPDSPVAVFYPSTSEPRTMKRGPFALEVARDGDPVRGNGRLVVVSHGSGGSPWVYADLATALVEAGFVVALPEHYRDNYRDPSQPGPESWKRRPLEVSHAIDIASGDPRFAKLLATDKVGVYGMSAGGHTALVLAGGRWSPSRYAAHCDAHLAEDFPACVGLATRLDGTAMDGVRMTLAHWIIDWKFSDTAWYTHNDPRIAAAIAGVPVAADFDPASLASPRIPLAIVSARKDKWLKPEFHSDAVLRACHGCEHLFDFANGGHGALLSPFPSDVTGPAADLLKDPPGFDRAESLAVNRKISEFFQRTLLPLPEARKK